LNAEPSFVGHLPAVKADLTCRENLAYEHSLGPPGLEVAEALASVGLAGLGSRAARALSAGQQRRLGMARLLVRRTPLWLLDEPYASLDDAGCERVDQLLAEHLLDGAAVLATHQRKPRIEPQRMCRITVTEAPREDAI
ncbi:MAG: ATP-binding cassette domain-containing protein, partial [Wenzhouxiangellaceae bacterium]